MATSVIYNGVTYSIPSYGDTGYAQGAGNLSLYLVALATGSLQTTGGIFSLLADVNFGVNFGLIALYYTSVHANPATAGTIRLANTDTIDWRNFANSGNDVLAVNGSDQLTYNGAVLATFGQIPVITPGQIVGTATNDNATAGNVGEHIQAVASNVVATDATFVNITSISLTAGDWDVTGISVYEANSGVTLGEYDGAVS